jgi:CheY-like chemotaxis protein
MPKRRSVLLVEDDDELRLVFRTVLVIAGFDVREAVDGLDALLRVESELPDVIVLDLGMPRVNGKDVLTELSRHASTQNIPIVIVTGSREELDEVDRDCILRKPVMPELLVETVRRCVKTGGGNPR